ncbi:MAG: biotin transporter BioY [Dehalococcoidales bacterium]|jgi:biotin transport system substrate-specific component
MTLGARISETKYQVFKWRYELALPKKAALACGMAIVMGLLAQLRVHVPWSPIPFTGQTLGVLLTGVLLGAWWGGISMGIYMGLGAAGVPWFETFSGGAAYIAGPTGGYIIGFILAALFLGYFTDKFVKSRRFLPMLGLMLFANFILIYGPGLLQLHFWLSLIKGEPAGFGQVMMLGAVPFIAGDIVKAVIAAAVARGVTPQRAYGKEADVR